jgi:hypothetical protein
MKRPAFNPLVIPLLFNAYQTHAVALNRVLHEAGNISGNLTSGAHEYGTACWLGHSGSAGRAGAGFSCPRFAMAFPLQFLLQNGFTKSSHGKKTKKHSKKVRKTTSPMTLWMWPLSLSASFGR